MEIDELIETCHLCQSRLSLSTLRKVGVACVLTVVLDKVQCI
jgi:hypothetical protein